MVERGKSGGVMRRGWWREREKSGGVMRRGWWRERRVEVL